MMKVVLKLDMHDEKIKQKAMKTVSGLTGVESIAMDAKDKKLTVMGDIDPVKVVAKLRKFCHTDILSVGPAKEPEKKKDEGKKDGPKKEDAKKGDDKKNDAKDDAAQFMKAYQYHQAYYQQPHYQYPASMPYYRTVEEADPNACAIC